MKTIGLIGGMSWESSIEYYRIINDEIKKRLGGLHSAKIIMDSLEFYEISELQKQNKWDEMTEIMLNSAKKLENAGADMILICTNTMHLMADKIDEETKIPLLHIADAAAESIKNHGLKKVGLLGTKFTMEEDFYKKRLKDKHNIEVIIPPEHERQIIHDIIFDELCIGIYRKDSKGKYSEFIDNLVKEGAEGIILGCTEIPLLINQDDMNVPIFDTLELHSKFAVDFALL